MKNKMMLAVFAATMIAFSSCKKNENELVTEPSENYSSLSDFFSRNGAPFQTFTIDATLGGVITGNQGTKITFPAHAFVDAALNLVNGNVTIQLREIYKKSDMLLSNVTTMNNGKPLKSGGEFYLMVNSGSQQLSIAYGKSYDVQMPASSVDINMIAYTGWDTSGFVNWYPANTSMSDSVNYNYVNLVDSSIGYLYSSNWLGWINCDHAYLSPNYTILVAHPTTASDQGTTGVYLIFGSTIVRMSGPVTPNNFTYFTYYYAPLGFHGTLVAITIKDGKLYSAFKPFTFSGGQPMDFTVSETTTDDFKAALDALN